MKKLQLENFGVQELDAKELHLKNDLVKVLQYMRILVDNGIKNITMEHCTEKQNRLYLFVLLLLFLTWISLELFKFGFELGEKRVNSTGEKVIKII